MLNKSPVENTRSAVGRPSRSRALGRAGGFTLIEILIATSILTLGLVGILALFPVAIHTGKQVVESSSSVVIGQSVVDSIRSGIRNSKGLSRSRPQSSYFILRHDGVTDKVPADPKLYNAKDDYYILLPRFPSERKFAAGSKGRADSLRRGSVFIYPESDKKANGGGNALVADNDGDDYDRTTLDGGAERTFRVEKVYRLGQKLIPGGDPNDGQFSDAFLEDRRVFKDMTIDQLRQYSFAIKVRNSFYDADASEAGSYEPANKLYHFTVLIFRGFPEEGQVKGIYLSIENVNRELRTNPRDEELLKRRAALEALVSPVERVYFEAAI